MTTTTVKDSSGAVVDQLTEAAGTEDVQVTVTVKAEDGSVDVSMSAKKTYELVTADEAKAIDKEIVSTVKAKVTLKNGKTKTVSMKIKVK